MRTFEFDETGDWTLGMVESIDEIRQAVEHNLYIRLGEWFLNESIGMDRAPFERKDYDIREITTEVTRTILEEERIDEVIDIDISHDDRTRLMCIRFTAHTQEGVLQSEIYR